MSFVAQPGPSINASAAVADEETSPNNDSVPESSDLDEDFGKPKTAAKKRVARLVSSDDDGDVDMSADNSNTEYVCLLMFLPKSVNLNVQKSKTSDFSLLV